MSAGRIGSDVARADCQPCTIVSCVRFGSAIRKTRYIPNMLAGHPPAELIFTYVFFIHAIWHS